MGATATPFDNILTQGQGTPPASTPSSSATPFDGILPSQAPAPPQSPEDKASNIRQSLVSGLTGMPTPNMTDADKQTFATGKAVGAGSATLVSAAPLLGALAPHLPTLDKAWKIAVALGGASATVDHVLHVMGILNGKK